jgi:integrase
MIRENPADSQAEIDARAGHCVVVYQGMTAGRFGAICHASSDPNAGLCWRGPTRSTCARAIEDGRLHQPRFEPWIHHSALEEIPAEPGSLAVDLQADVTSSSSFEDHLVGVGLSGRTIYTYSNLIRIVERRLAVEGLALVDADARALMAVAESFPNSYSRRAQLRSALKHFYEWQGRDRPPVRAVRVPRRPKMVCKALDAGEARRLFEISRGWWPQGGAVLLGLFLALRREEIACAEWERFDETMEWYTVTGKYDKTATIPVSPILAAELAPLRSSGYLFPAGGLKPWKVRPGHISPTTVWHWTKTVATAAGISHDVKTHQLRHTSLTTALDRTENLRAVMEFARHERPDVTAGYTRTTRDQLRTISDAITY